MDSLLQLLESTNFDDSHKYGQILSSLTENMTTLVGMLISSEQEINSLKHANELLMIERDQLKSNISLLEDRNGKLISLYTREFVLLV